MWLPHKHIPSNVVDHELYAISREARLRQPGNDQSSGWIQKVKSKNGKQFYSQKRTTHSTVTKVGKAFYRLKTKFNMQLGDYLSKTNYIWKTVIILLNCLKQFRAFLPETECPIEQRDPKRSKAYPQDGYWEGKGTMTTAEDRESEAFAKKANPGESNDCHQHLWITTRQNK